MLRAAGFALVDTPEEEVFICHVVDRPSIEAI
jgi:hypothetical protein